LWHHRLGRPTSRIFQFLVLKNKTICNNKCLNFQCQSCPLGKCRICLYTYWLQTSAPLELIFSDVWGPAPLFFGWLSLFFYFFYAHTKCIWYYPLVAKSDVYFVFHQFQTLVERQFYYVLALIFVNRSAGSLRLSSYHLV
jgi:hypothetical protein